MNSLRIGVLGASRIAEVAIVEPAQILGHRLVACAARDTARASVFAEKYGVDRVLDSYQDVIDDSEVDVVYNPLANSLHAPWNLAAVRAGKPVLTEKPFARDRVEAATVRDAAATAGVTVMEGFHYLFHPVTRRLQQLLEDGTLGELRHVEVVMRMPAPDPADLRWSLDLAGGVMMDLGCYGLHAQRLFGRFAGGAPIVASASAVQRYPGVDESIDVDLEFPSGATGVSRNSMIDPDYLFTLKVVGSKGEAFAHNYIKPNEDDRVSVTVGSTTTVEQLGTRSSYTYQLEAFADHVVNGAALPLDAADAVTNMAMIDDAYRAAGMSPR
ncbi:Gfo/Idh/MocA family protein [Rhodococcoides fascians]|uniref:Gfo/Idh/MocA family protein n=1 Tax=Rhodococcoides fascians TaxID=1828 RepID=UPI00056D54BF|nr:MULTISPECIES: Gfo/Idh/MocA family oxidoreductase [Rhodococcus]OZF07349.1 gfo/Idh/MocA family oxidoreductase [Rhodococcus sp. 15-1189-1-1a]OZF22874.1 gfo/Idh/MocA family oxidoreductase [Rhodococcus sp. 14-2686-1-2]